jgi:uncharacterized RDD family membrane protein YckC
MSEAALSPSFRNPAPHPIMTLASRSDRFIAQLLDGAFAITPLIGLAIFGPFLPEAVTALVYLPTLILCLGYIIFADALPGGQSYGKQMLGIAVVDRRSGRPCSVWQSFVRNVLLSILGILDWVFILGDRHERLGDKAAGTIVVDEVPARAPAVGVGA